MGDWNELKASTEDLCFLRKANKPGLSSGKMSLSSLALLHHFCMEDAHGTHRHLHVTEYLLHLNSPPWFVKTMALSIYIVACRSIFLSSASHPSVFQFHVQLHLVLVLNTCTPVPAATKLHVASLIALWLRTCSNIDTFQTTCVVDVAGPSRAKGQERSACAELESDGGSCRCGWKRRCIRGRTR